MSYSGNNSVGVGPGQVNADTIQEILLSLEATRNENRIFNNGIRIYKMQSPGQAVFYNYIFRFYGTAIN